MNEATTITFSDWSKGEQEFAEIIIQIIESTHKRYEHEHRELDRSRVPLADITISPKHFEDFLHIMQGIKRYQEPQQTVREMLGAFCQKGEIYLHIPSFEAYRLSKEGLLYKHLAGKLASTP